MLKLGAWSGVLMIRLCSLLLLVVGAILPYQIARSDSARAALSSPPASAWADDAPMAHHGAGSVGGLPVSDLLARLATETDISVSAIGGIGDEKVLVYASGREMGQLLA